MRRTRDEAVPDQHVPARRRTSVAGVPGQGHGRDRHDARRTSGGGRLGLRRRPARPEHGDRAAPQGRRRAHHRRPIHRGQGAPRRVHHHQGAGPGRGAGVGPQVRAGDHAAHRGTAVPGRSRGLMPPSAAEIEEIFRAEYGRAVAVLNRSLGDLDSAEDAVQDAFTVAVQRWPADGLPPSPAGWIITTARNRAIDRLRREASREDRHARAALLHASREPAEEGPVSDDRLRLIFTCCHPALSPEAQVALTLRLLGGLSTDEVARAFLISEPTMAQRLVRAKHKIKAARIPYRVPAERELSDRLGAVLSVLYLIYTAGLNSLSERGLCGEAIRLSRTLRVLMPD